MKRIIFLLLLTVSVYGQNPSRFAKIQITGNANSGTATKVNVQEANGEVNTQTINTGFNKNIGLGGSDVVGANTLLNQYSTTPIDWTATVFNSGQVVFYGGKQWIAKMATVAGDAPSVSSKWEEITFEALANKTTTVDQTIIDGSTNSVSGNAVFDGLALKSNIGHTHVASQITDLSKASVGLGNVDNTSDLSKPLNTATINALATKAPISSVHNPITIGTANGLSLSTQQLSLGLASSGVTGALSGTDWNTFNNKQDAFSKNTAFNKNFGTTAGTVVEGGTLGSNAYNSTAYLPLSGGTLSGNLNVNSILRVGDSSYNSTIDQAGIGKITSEFTSGRSYTKFYGHTGNAENYLMLSIDGLGNSTFTGTVTASPATTANQVVVKSQLDAVASSGTYTPSNQTNAAQTVNFIRSYWERKGNVLTVTTSLTYTVTQIQSTAGFLITLPNGFLVSGANGRIIGSSLLHTTQGIFNNNANMKAYEASDSSKINLQANFQATVSSGTYETTIIYTVLIQ